jgi:hypothetical protein
MDTIMVQKSFFMADFFIEHFDNGIGVMKTLRSDFEKVVLENDTVGLTFLYRDLLEQVQDLPIPLKRLFLQQALANGLHFQLKQKSELELIKAMVKQSIIPDEFHYSLLKEFYDNLKNTPKLSERKKKIIAALLKRYEQGVNK